MTPTDIGTFMACAERRAPANHMSFIRGMAEGYGGEKGAAAQRLIVKAAHACMVFTKQSHTAPAHHLFLVSDSPVWNLHCQDVAADVVRTLQVLEPMHKQAFSELMDAGHTAAKGIGYTSLAAGGGLGALYWLLSRHSNQEDANLQAKQHQVDYYHQLNRELQDSMRRKYNYDPNAEQQSKSRVKPSF